MIKEDTFLMLNSVLEGFNYTKTGKYWRREGSNIIFVIQYQSSRYFDGFFLNLGVAFKELLSKKKRVIKIDDCHLIARYSQVFKDFNPSEKKVLSQKESENLKTNILKLLLPFIENLESKEFLIKNYREKVPNEIWWLQNLDEEEYLAFINR